MEPTVKSQQISSAAVSDRGLSDKRPVNEDSFLEIAEKGIFVVADGVGGAQAGEVASQMAVEIIGEAFANLSVEADPEDTMKAAIEKANEAIFQMSQDLPQLSSMATTVVGLHIAHEVATIAHVGDSRLYRLDPTGRLFRETADHSVVEEEVRAGRMTPEQAATHPSRNVISRALGAEPTVKIDLKMQIVKPATKFLLCTDGVTRHIDDWELAAILSSGDSVQQMCNEIKRICFDRGAEDNLTAIIVEAVGTNDAVVKDIENAYEADTIASERQDAVPINILLPDDEENTIAASPQIAEPLAVNESDDDAFLMEVSDDRDDVADADYTSSSVVVPARQEPVAASDAVERADTPFSYDEPPAERGFLGSFLSSLMLLAIGALVGIAAFYFLIKPAEPAPIPQTPVITEQKSNNVPLTTFEDGRRLVDKDPEGYLTANAASPQSAEDYFLLGRAFLLTGKQWEAKRAFSEARSRLSQADPLNSATLANEIAMALAIIESPSAAETFRKSATRPADAQNSQPANSANSEPVPVQ